MKWDMHKKLYSFSTTIKEIVEGLSRGLIKVRPPMTSSQKLIDIFPWRFELVIHDFSQKLVRVFCFAHGSYVFSTPFQPFVYQECWQCSRSFVGGWPFGHDRYQATKSWRACET